MATDPRAPTVVHCQDEELVAHVTPDSSSPTRAWPPIVAQRLPFQDSVKVLARPTPTARQRSDEEHDTPSSSDRFWAAGGSGTTVHADPSKDSVRPTILALLDPRVPSAPTARQALGLVQDTLVKMLKFVPACTADISDQCLPSQSKMRGFSPRVLGDVPVTAAPTATQNCTETHDTLVAKKAPVPEGAAIVDQDLPFHETMRGAELEDDEEIAAPTPTQNLAVTQETPINSPFLAEPLLLMVDQPAPFHDSNRVSTSSADALGALEPTAAQKLRETQETPSRSVSLADVEAGVTMDHLRPEDCVVVIDAVVVKGVVVDWVRAVVGEKVVEASVTAASDTPRRRGKDVITTPQRDWPLARQQRGVVDSDRSLQASEVEERAPQSPVARSIAPLLDERGHCKLARRTRVTEPGGPRTPSEIPPCTVPGASTKCGGHSRSSA